MGIELKIKPAFSDEKAKIKWKDLEEMKFAGIIVNHFFRLKNSHFELDGVSRDEKNKNLYLAKQFYRKLKDKNIDFEISENIDSEKLFSQFLIPDFWKGIADFMFEYADADILKYYSQTINGIFKFYFKHYGRLKALLDSRSLSGEDRLLLSQVRKWNKNDVVNCFHCYIAKLYRYLRPDVNFKVIKQSYYIYIKFITTTQPPLIKQIVLENNQLLRGLLLQFEPKLEEWCKIMKISSNSIIDYTWFKNLCEIKGVVLAKEVTEKDLDDIVGEAITKFFEV